MSVLSAVIAKHYPRQFQKQNEPWNPKNNPPEEIEYLLLKFIEDVNTELSNKGEAVRLYRLSDITVDLPTFQPRLAMSEEFINRYRDCYDNGMELPPVDVGTLADDDTNTLYLLDGFHRYYARQKLGSWENYIAAIPHDNITLNEARYFAVEKNLANGYAFTMADKQNILRIYIETGQHKLGCGNVKSYRTILKELGIFTLTTLHRYMTEMFPDVAAEIRRQHPYKTKPKEQDELKEEETDARPTDIKAVKALDKALSMLSKRAEAVNDNAAALRYESSLLALLNDSRKRWGRTEIERAEEYREEEDF